MRVPKYTPPPPTDTTPTLLTGGSTQYGPQDDKLACPNQPSRDWPLYLNLLDMPLWEAVALSINVPEPPHLMSIVNNDFDKRMRIALTHMKPTGELSHVEKANPYWETRVRLADIAHLAEFCTPKWELPPEFPAATAPVPAVNSPVIRFITLHDLVVLISKRSGGNFSKAAREILDAFRGHVFMLYQLNINGYRMCTEIWVNGQLQHDQDAIREVTEELAALILNNQFLSNPNGGLAESCHAYVFNIDEIAPLLNLVMPKSQHPGGGWQITTSAEIEPTQAETVNKLENLAHDKLTPQSAPHLPTDAIKSRQSLSDKEAQQLSASKLADWVESAREIAKVCIDKHKLDDLYPSQNDVCAHVEEEMRKQKIFGAHGNPLDAKYIQRNAIQGEWWQKNKNKR